MDVESDRSLESSFVAEVRKAMRFYHVDDALNGLSLRELHQVRALLQEQPALTAPQAIRTALDAGLARLHGTDADAAALLRWRFVERDPAERVAQAGRLAARGLAGQQNRALQLLASEIWRAERAAVDEAALSEEQRRALHSLPARTYTRLFGVGQSLGRLKDCLRDTESFWLVALDGMGGVGKTALARAAAEDLVREGRFERVVWILARRLPGARNRSRPSIAPALSFPVLLDEIAAALHLEGQVGSTEAEREARVRAALSALATLVVVDNLETAPDVDALVAGLDRLARPTKVLVTTRVRIGRLVPVVSLSVRRLERRYALDLIEYRATVGRAGSLAGADRAGLERLADLAGDNPLAIRVALAQTRSRPLEAVLEDLALARAATASLYDYILRYAWQGLSEPARHLLMHVPLLHARGAPYQQLVAIAGEPPAGGWVPALEELVDACLLDAGWEQGEVIYSIHRLTEHFVVAQVGQSAAFSAAVERAARYWLSFWQAHRDDRPALLQTRGHAARALLWCAEGRHCPELAADLAVALHARIVYMGN